MYKTHSWSEGASQRSSGSGHSWENRAPAAATESDSSSEDELIQTWEDRHIAHQLDLYLARSLSAKDFCIGMYNVGQMGEFLKCRRLGKPPGSDDDSGHYQRHLNDKLGFNIDAVRKLYPITAPITGSSGKREVGTIMGYPLIDQLEADITPELSSQLAAWKRDGKLPMCYYRNPIVVAFGSTHDVFPFFIYLDGVPYSLVDSVLAFWAINLLTGQRYVLVVVTRGSYNALYAEKKNLEQL
jgi:hypothetical protein